VREECSLPLLTSTLRFKQALQEIGQVDSTKGFLQSLFNALHILGETSIQANLSSTLNVPAMNCPII